MTPASTHAGAARTAQKVAGRAPRHAYFARRCWTLADVSSRSASAAIQRALRVP